jgi:preprotein translocase subunit SecF
MTIFTSIILVAVIVVGVSFLAYYMQRGTKAMSEFKMDFDNNKQAQELAELAKELYNKDLRPIVAKKAPKKDKVTQQVEAMKKVVEAHDTLVEEIAKVEPEVPVTPVQVETVVEEVKKETKPEFPIDKPKKKRKYYPKKK